MLSVDVTHYVELRRALGFKFRTQDILLRSFASFAEQRGERFVSTSCTLDWAGQAPSPQQRRNRLLTVRRFALSMIAEDFRHEVPPANVFGDLSFQRIRPHIYTPDELAVLLSAASELAPKGSIRPATYVTLFGLLVATGMRISEALALQVDDYTDDGLLIRETKFHKSRLVPVHETTVRAVDRYLDLRGQMGTPDRSLFISPQGTAMNYNTVRHVFLKLARATGLRSASGRGGPRIHDFRHTFAVRSLERCAANAQVIKRHIVALSTYLGHAHVTDTYWYLQTTPELMSKISAAGESLLSGGAP